MKILGKGILLLLLLWIVPTTVYAKDMLVPVGQVVGLELGNQTVTVAAIDNKKTEEMGLHVGDRIIKIDGSSVKSPEDVRRLLSKSNGEVELSVVRKGKNLTLHLTPTITEDGPKLGVYLRNGITGIGTVTFFDPETGLFGTLGHGVNDDTGKLLQLAQGNAYPATVLSVRKGKSGEPGQLIGTLAGTQPVGELVKNTAQGVFGKASQGFLGPAIPVGDAQDVRTGEAVIRSTVGGETVGEYGVEIVKIYPASRANGRNMLIRVTDPRLLAVTGGIVQGMSGSPLVQDGKLIGAVTHVLVNDPTMGYGIFIENMLEAAG